MTLKTLLVALAFALSAVAVAAPSADATPIDQFVDCADSFWTIACGGDPTTTARGESGHDVQCGIVPAVGEPGDWFYLPVRGECTECFTVTVLTAVQVVSRSVECRPWP